jgi:hypothetical protein
MLCGLEMMLRRKLILISGCRRYAEHVPFQDGRVSFLGRKTSSVHGYCTWSLEVTFMASATKSQKPGCLQNQSRRQYSSRESQTEGNYFNLVELA